MLPLESPSVPHRKMAAGIRVPTDECGKLQHRSASAGNPDPHTAVPSELLWFREKIASAATLDEVNEWGKRKLAYPINDEPDGYYTLYTFTSTPDVPAEVERVLNITDGVLRSLVTVK